MCSLLITAHKHTMYIIPEPPESMREMEISFGKFATKKECYMRRVQPENVHYYCAYPQHRVEERVAVCGTAVSVLVCQ